MDETTPQETPPLRPEMDLPREGLVDDWLEIWGRCIELDVRVERNEERLEGLRHLAARVERLEQELIEARALVAEARERGFLL